MEGLVTVGKLDWEVVKSMETGQGTYCKFVPAGKQFYDGLTKSEVKALKYILQNLLQV